MNANERYLGDGLYVSSDGYQIILRAPRLEGDHWVALEPHVLNAFLAYVNNLQEKGDPDGEDGGAA